MQNKNFKKHIWVLAAIFVFVSLASATFTHGAWKKDGVEIVRGTLDDVREYSARQTAIFDKSGIIFTYNFKGGGDYYIQKINAQAEKIWGQKGVYIGKSAKLSNYNIISDGFGGVIIVFNDHNKNKIYAQRINKLGEKRWKILIAQATSGATPPPLIVSDKNNGAIISWYDFLVANGINVVRIDYAGNITWRKTGKEIFKDRSQGHLRMVTDKKGYIYVNNQGKYLQKIDRNGQNLWPDSGIEILPVFSTGGNYDYRMIYNNKDGIIIVGSKGENKLFAQKIDFWGNLKWPKSGVFVFNYAYIGSDYDLVPDGNGGVIVSWIDDRVSQYGDVYAQKINSKGKRAWGRNDKAIKVSSIKEELVALSGQKGTIVKWLALGSYHFQKINRRGALQWGSREVILDLFAPLFQKVNKNLFVIGSKYVNKEGEKEDGFYIYVYKIDNDGNILGD